MTDSELIQQFRGGDDAAFAELVARHARWVRQAARRRVGDVHLAEDVTQAVFILLARKAASIKSGMVVSAWLFQAMRYCSASALRAQRRRKLHEKEAALMRTQVAQVDAGWEQVVPVLDESVARLGRRDREAVLLRFYQQKPWAEVGAELGISQEGARKRVSRALARLRSMLSRRGAVLSADGLSATLMAGLTGDLSGEAVKGLAPAALAAARMNGTASAAAMVARSAARLMLWGQVKLAAAIGMAAMLVGGAGTVAIVAQTRATAVAQAPATLPAVDAATLVAEVKESQAWLARVQSFHAKFEGESITNPEGIPPGPPPRSTVPPNSLRAIGRRIGEFSEQQAATQPAPASSKAAEYWELAFDGNRLYERWWTTAQGAAEGTGEMRLWDGKGGMHYLRTSFANEEYSLFNTPKQVAQFFMMLDIWGRNGQRYWWMESASDFIRAPEDYRLAGREVFHGVDCYVLEQWGWIRLYVGVTDHRLYGLRQGVLPDSAYAEWQKIARQIAGEMGKTIRSDAELSRWRNSLPAEKQRQLGEEENKRVRPLIVPRVLFWYGDYHEVAPGCWFPGIVGRDSWDQNHASRTYLSGRAERKLTSVAVNKPLPQELFAYTLKDGVTVWDSRELPVLRYLQKADRAPAEWEAIRADARRVQKLGIGFDEKFKGQPAPDFPAGAKWVGGGPLKWADLRGKVVVLSFWADWRGFGGYTTRQVPDGRTLAGLKSEIVMIGVHPPTDDLVQVQRAMKQYGMDFPVCIDVRAKAREAPWGAMIEQYPVELPKTFLIDREGKIAGTFLWPTVIKKAQELAAEAGM